MSWTHQDVVKADIRFRKIFNIAGYSAHGDQNDILAWVSSFRSELKSIFINHGEAESGQVLGEQLSLLTKAHIYRPVLGEEFNLS